MNGELATAENRNAKGEKPRRGTIKATTRAALMATWEKLSPNLAGEPFPGESPKQTERRVRIAWANGKLHPQRLDKGKADITSFNELTEGEARYLLPLMREESGDGPAYRGLLIGRLAVELFGPDWNNILAERLCQRFRIFRPQLLEPHEGHEIIEELLSRLARRDGVGIEEVRARIRRSNHRAIGSSGDPALRDESMARSADEPVKDEP